MPRTSPPVHDAECAQSRYTEAAYAERRPIRTQYDAHDVPRGRARLRHAMPDAQTGRNGRAYDADARTSHRGSVV